VWDRERLLAEALAGLPPTQRSRRYRELAATAFQRANTSRNRALKAEYLVIAAAWLALAMQIEREASSGAPEEKPSDGAG
jgi:hypothetical protein